MTFCKVALPLEVTSQSWVKIRRQLKVNKISVNGQMALFPHAVTIYLCKELMRPLQKTLRRYNPRYN